MPVDLRLGRRPARQDSRIPFLGALRTAATLAAPPPTVNWYAAVGDWGMLGNDQFGCCAEAAIGHAVLQWSTYAGAPAVPTDAETLALYSAITGFDATKPATDQGTYVLGPGGALEYWATKGVTFGGVRSFATAYAQVALDDTALRLRQAIHYFGGVLVGINLPQSVLAADTVPYLWEAASGPIAGGHAIFVDGYDATGPEMVFDLVSWGARYAATLSFLRATLEETVAVYDPVSMLARGTDGAGFDGTELLAAMTALKSSAPA